MLGQKHATEEHPDMSAPIRRLLIVFAFVLSLSLLTPTGRASQQTKLIPDSGETWDFFGFSVAIDGGLILSGALGDNSGVRGSGAAYVFEASTGELLTQLVPDQDVGYNAFGSSVALSDGLALVGSSDPISGSAFGSAYLFDARTGAQLRELRPESTSLVGSFGSSVALDEGLALVGAVNADRRGAAYVFDVATGDQLAKLIPAEGTHARFGGSVALEGGLALVGSSRDRNDGDRAGAAYLFDAVTGEQLAKLTPDVDAFDFFGASVALDGNLALVTATGSDFHGVPPAAYVFDVADGEQLVRFSPTGLISRNQFGFSAVLKDGIALIGAPFIDGGPDLGGSVYAFDTVSGELITEITPYDGMIGDGFGISTDIDQGRADAYKSCEAEHDGRGLGDAAEIDEVGRA